MFSFIGRILEIFVAFAMLRSVLQIVFRILRGVTGARSGGAQPPPQKSAATPPGTTASGGASASTLLHQDPVCGTYVAAGSSFRKIYKGQVYHFCSEECRDRYAV